MNDCVGFTKITVGDDFQYHQFKITDGVTMRDHNDNSMKGISPDAKRKILFESYKASANAAMVLVGIVAVVVMLFLSFTFLEIGRNFYGEYVTKYRILYFVLFLVALLYEAVRFYVKRDLYGRFMVLDFVNPIVALLSFIWAIRVSWYDAHVTGFINPTLYMTFSLAVPLCFYMNHIVYTVIMVISDIIMLHVFYLYRTDGISWFSMSTAYLYIFFIIQLFMGLYLLNMKRNLSERILRVESQKVEIEELSDAQNNFFASMSHEIRTPINTIIGLDEMILRSNISDEVREDAENIQSAGKILLHLLNDLLDISKIDTGMMELTRAAYKTRDMFYEIWGMLNIRAEEKGLRFTVEVTPRLPQRLLGDEVRIKQILINLINNAIKYTKEGTVNLKVESVNDVGVEDVYYVVEDTGIGIRKESMPYIFTAYKRVNEEKNKYIEGTGLGLSIVNKLVKLMGGDIKVDSVYGEGSRFTVRIPQRVVDAEPIGEFDVTDAVKERNTDIYYSMFEAPDARILVVDDTPANLVVAKKLLRDTKVMIDTAENGIDALTKTMSAYYHVIFMDHFMPLMDGVECIRRIREQENGYCKNSKIVVLTANVAPENEVEYIKAGFDGYLTKPITGKSIEEELLRQLPEGMINRVVGKERQKNKDEDDELDESLKNIFISTIDETARKLDVYLQNEDIKNYTIVVHGLKSTANLAGESDISQKAAVLEEAGKNNDIEKISRLHANFISEYLACKKSEEGEKKNGEKLSKGEVKEAYMTISEYALAKDFTLTEMLLSDLEQYDLDDEDQKNIKKLKDVLNRMDYDSLYRMAQDMC